MSGSLHLAHDAGFATTTYGIGYSSITTRLSLPAASIPHLVHAAATDQFTVLVKTKRFDTIGSIPDGIVDEQSVQGLLINRISGLDSEEENLIKQSFPQVNLDTVLILEEGRKPSGLLKSLGMMFGGLTLAVVGVGLMFVGRGGGE